MTIEILFPDVANLFGDLMNMRYLSLALPDAEIVRTPLRGKPAFAARDVELVYIGAMPESKQAPAIRALAPYADEIRRRVSSGGAVLATGNAFELFGKYIENEDGERIAGLDVLDAYSVRFRPQRRNSLYLGRFGECDIVGFNSRFSHTYGGEEPLFRTTRGIGVNPNCPDEGIRRNNFMGTYILGPILALNPPLTRQLLRLIGAPDAAPPCEEAATAAYDARLSVFRDSRTNFIYS
jgi:CobQ-like glutamine amidotransferase family enzyme